MQVQLSLLTFLQTFIMVGSLSNLTVAFQPFQSKTLQYNPIYQPRVLANTNSRFQGHW